MFWLDNDASQGRRVVRADMDGTNPIVIARNDITEYANHRLFCLCIAYKITITALFRLSHIALDTIGRRVYFSEAKAGRISSVAYDGADAHYVLNDAQKQPNGIAFLNNRLYYADSAFDKILVADTSLGGDQPLEFSDFKTRVEGLVNIKVKRPKPNKNFHVSYSLIFQVLNPHHAATHPCATTNGNCEHLCIPTAHAQFKCACATGYKLDGTTKCTLLDSSFLVIATRTRVSGLEIDASHTKRVAIEPIGGTAITSVDIDYASKAIYIAEAGGPNKGITRVTLDGGEATPIVRNPFGGFSIRSLAVDWINYNLVRSVCVRLCKLFKQKLVCI